MTRAPLLLVLAMGVACSTPAPPPPRTPPTRAPVEPPAQPTAQAPKEPPAPAEARERPQSTQKKGKAAPAPRLDQIRGPTPSATLGPAPAGGARITLLEVANKRPTARRGALAYAGVPIPRSLNLTDVDGLAVIGPGGTLVPAQFHVLSRWGGPVADLQRPARWLEVSLTADVAAKDTSVYELRRLPSTPTDPAPARIDATEGTWTVDTGRATFVLDPTNPALLSEIRMGARQVYTHQPGAGPRLSFVRGKKAFTLGTKNKGRVRVDPGGFRVLRRGPVRVVVALNGHFVHPRGKTRCRAIRPGYESMGYTVIATFTRGSANVDLELHFTNECSDAINAPWTDDAVTVERFSWELPLDLGAKLTRYTAGSGDVAASSARQVRVEQRRGGGEPWKRQATVSQAGKITERAEAFRSPMVAVRGDAGVAAIHMPWMRFREPQALVARGGALSIRPISSRLVVGEAKGVWNLARISLAEPGADLEAIRAAADADLSAGLLVRAPTSYVNTTGVFADLGTGRSRSRAAKTFREVITTVHRDTLRSQWPRAKTYGSQLWPDIQFDPWGTDNPTPYDNNGVMNYWNPSGAELIEFIRTGDPRWVWQFAMPQSWLQMHTAYCNLGERSHGNRNGFALASGGTGEGHWHRGSGGSDDYTYDMGMNLAYALRPTPTVQRRFAQAGLTFQKRYSIPRKQQRRREEYVSQLMIIRQTVQHYELLANCAEFVPGDEGRACDRKLREVLEELSQDNWQSGLLCEDDAPATKRCSVGQNFMINSLHVPFFYRMVLNYPDITAPLRRAIVGNAMRTYAHALTKERELALEPAMSLDALVALPDRPRLVADGPWWNRMECPLTDGGRTVVTCERANDPGADALMLGPNKPHTMATLLLAHALDPRVRLCAVAKEALDDPNLLAGWDDYFVSGTGWTKGTSQMVQSMAFAIGLAETCEDPPAP